MASENEHRAQAQHEPAQAAILDSNKSESLANMSVATNGQAPPRRNPLFDDDDDDDGDDVASTTSSSNHDTVTVTSPPYWHSTSHPPNHPASNGLRPLSTASIESVLPPGAITLQDNESDLPSSHFPSTSPTTPQDRNRSCWARSVTITDYITINTSSTNIGAFTVWNISVETLEGPRINIRKRYSEFDDLRKKLIMTFPGFEAAVPELPPKSLVKRFKTGFLEKRRGGLQYFLNCILLNPEFSGAPVVREFLFS